ncbi:hypothetical protein ARTSIC4J27_615 [Pseudarthrobacter siccitolerans]|uniref:Uncharacterized protein n=1 Tax=Pseudarthrobacter siccitolerans TaxID=861266 RepID=A0A024GYX4_9MICC|nr:hypothetical protein [Pseudarthrobacter siccitolerans]CCQ44686.1 hypothetical protein ARTSIC4J27_615 [Pseudarthrobacter siccitolerans]
MPDFPTFTLKDSHHDTLTIERENDDRLGGAVVANVSASNVYVPREQAPAAALAILEAAQAHNLDGTVSQAIVCLRSHLAHVAAVKRREEAEREAAEAKARQELDAATLAAYNAFRTSAPLGFVSAIESLDELPESVRAAWGEAVKAARASA